MQYLNPSPAFRRSLATAFAALLVFFLTACVYRNSDTTDAPFPVGLDGVYGYVDQKGEWVIPPQFDAAHPFTDDGTTWVQFEGRYGRIDRKGGWALQPEFEDVGALAENGLARARDGNGKQGFINAQGEWVVPPKFEYVGNFAANGLAEAKDGNEKIGFINAQGEWAVPPKFKFAWNFGANGLVAVVDDNEKFGLINAQGEWVVPLGWDASALDSAPLKWRAGADARELLNARGEVVLVVARVCGVEVSRNPGGEITWPKKSAERICEEAGAAAAR
jgi:hypothetical protein